MLLIQSWMVGNGWMGSVWLCFSVAFWMDITGRRNSRCIPPVCFQQTLTECKMVRHGGEWMARLGCRTMLPHFTNRAVQLQWPNTKHDSNIFWYTFMYQNSDLCHNIANLPANALQYIFYWALCLFLVHMLMYLLPTSGSSYHTPFNPTYFVLISWP